MLNLCFCSVCGTVSTKANAKYCAKCGEALINVSSSKTLSIATGEKELEILQAMLQELKTITAEMQSLKCEVQGRNSDSLPKQAFVASIESIDVPPEKLTEERTSLLLSWLKNQHIDVKEYRRPEDEDEVFDALSMFLGDKYESLSRLHDLIRKNLQTGSSFSLNLSGKSQEEIANNTNFCSQLNVYAFLSSYHYNSSAKTIYATPQKMGKVTNFFNGGWFERFVVKKISALFSENGLSYECLSNPKIVLQNGDSHELDMLFFEGEQPLWIECKTGDYQAYINKYSTIRKTISVPKRRSVLIVLGIADALSAKLTSIFDITVASQGNFLEKIRSTLDRSKKPKHIAVNTELKNDKEKDESEQKAINKPSSLSVILNNSHLRPLPEYRMSVIKKLISVVQALEQPKNMTEVKTMLAEQLTLSKSQLQDILNAIVRSGCLLDNAGNVVSSFSLPFATLVSVEPDIIEGHCLESYVVAVLKAEPDYFDDAHNISKFEQTVGVKVSDITVFDMVKQNRLMVGE